MPSLFHTRLSRRDLTVPLLAIAGGGVDAIGLRGLGVLTAAQTGNTIRFAASLADGKFTEVLFSAMSLGGYVAGAALGTAIGARGADAGRAQTIRRALAVETALVAGLLAGWLITGQEPGGDSRGVFIVLAALAMGMQSATVLQLHVRPATTYVTGTLTAFTTELVAGPGEKTRSTQQTAVHPGASRDRRHRSGDRRSSSIFTMDQPWIYGATWFIYAIGAIAGALLFRWQGPAALVLPLAALVAVCATLVS